MTHTTEEPVGLVVEESVGLVAGESVGLVVGESVGLVVGESVVQVVEESVGLIVGEPVEQHQSLSQRHHLHRCPKLSTLPLGAPMLKTIPAPTAPTPVLGLSLAYRPTRTVSPT